MYVIRHMMSLTNQNVRYMEKKLLIKQIETLAQFKKYRVYTLFFCIHVLRDKHLNHKSPSTMLSEVRVDLECSSYHIAKQTQNISFNILFIPLTLSQKFNVTAPSI